MNVASLHITQTNACFIIISDSAEYHSFNRDSHVLLPESDLIYMLQSYSSRQDYSKTGMHIVLSC